MRRPGRPSRGGREAILSAALALIRERGVANVRTLDVAARAGFSEATIFYHFQDRLGLLESALLEGMSPPSLREEIDGRGSDRQDVIAGAVHAMLAFFARTAPLIAAAQSDPALSAALAARADGCLVCPQSAVRALVDFLGEEQIAGRVGPSADVHVVALMLIETCFGLVLASQWAGAATWIPSVERVIAEINRALD